MRSARLVPALAVLGALSVPACAGAAVTRERLTVIPTRVATGTVWKPTGLTGRGLLKAKVSLAGCRGPLVLQVGHGAAVSSARVSSASPTVVKLRPALRVAAPLRVRVEPTDGCRRGLVRVSWLSGPGLAATAPAPAPATKASLRADPLGPATPSGVHWGLIGDETANLAAERTAGLGFKVVRLSWKDMQPLPGLASASYLVAKANEISAVRAAGFSVVLDLGLQDTPTWVHTFPNSYLVEQDGEPWTASTEGDAPIDKSDANLIFNPVLRGLAATYVAEATASFGSSVAGIRVGGGRFNETGYPVASTPTHKNTYWAYDALAQASSPVPGWRPGDPSPNGEAGRFLDWYLDSLTKFQDWQLKTVRALYSGPIIVLYPSWGLRPGQADAAIAQNLSGATGAELTGEVQRGHDPARFIAAIQDIGVRVETTWLDAPYGSDASADPAQWTPVHFLRSLLDAHSPALPLWGENTGEGGAHEALLSAQRARTYTLEGAAWFNEDELFSGHYATLNDLSSAILRG